MDWFQDELPLAVIPEQKEFIVSKFELAVKDYACKYFTFILIFCCCNPCYVGTYSRVAAYFARKKFRWCFFECENADLKIKSREPPIILLQNNYG